MIINPNMALYSPISFCMLAMDKKPNVRRFTNVLHVRNGALWGTDGFRIHRYQGNIIREQMDEGAYRVLKAGKEYILSAEIDNAFKAPDSLELVLLPDLNGLVETWLPTAVKGRDNHCRTSDLMWRLSATFPGTTGIQWRYLNDALSQCDYASKGLDEKFYCKSEQGGETYHAMIAPFNLNN